MELDAAGRVFRPARRRARPGPGGGAARGGRRTTAGGLTAREVEVLRLVATGKTNREIAAALVISDHTVRRHLQNIFAKLGVPSRAAATAFAVPARPASEPAAWHKRTTPHAPGLVRVVRWQAPGSSVRMPSCELVPRTRPEFAPDMRRSAGHARAVRDRRGGG